MSRVISREETFKLIFEFCATGELNDLTVNEMIETNKEVDVDYVNNVYYGVVNHFDELKEDISKTTKSFSVDRIFKVDFALLLLALYEIKYMPDVPNAVSVNEVLNLSKKYSTEKSSSYINGILANFVKVENNDQVNAFSNTNK